MFDELDEIERKTREHCGLSAEDVELYRALLRAEPDPSCPPMTAREHREAANQIDELEKLFFSKEDEKGE